ncbi:MAG: N-acetylglucosamine-6-phosphate deacetylase [Myxococcota bacterium]
MRCLLDDAILLDPEAAAPEPGALLIEDGRIRARLPVGATSPDARRYPLGGRMLAPGFLDVHYHGGLIFDARGLDDAMREAASLVTHGTTGYLATTVAWAPTELVGRLEGLVAAQAEAPPGAQPLGVHLEGPWIHPDAAGAQPRTGIRPFDASEAETILAAGAGRIRMVTLAPELEGATRLLERLAQRGVVGALGHSRASSEQALSGVDAGARHVTHLFNAMGPFHHREPGLVGVALADSRLSADLICDGVHVHPLALGFAAQALGERLLAITDQLAPPPGEPSFGSGALHAADAAWRTESGALAGSRLHMDEALRNLEGFAELSILEAVSACTLRPARLIGVEGERGSLRVGARADLVVLDPDRTVHETWVGGRCLFGPSAG